MMPQIVDELEKSLILTLDLLFLEAIQAINHWIVISVRYSLSCYCFNILEGWHFYRESHWLICKRVNTDILQMPQDLIPHLIVNHVRCFELGDFDVTNNIHRFNIINKMYENSLRTNAIASKVVGQIMENFQTQLLAKQVVKKIPEKLTEDTKQLTSQIIFPKHLPFPNTRKQPPLIEDHMPDYPSKQKTLKSNVPVITRQHLSRLELESAYNSQRNSATPRYLSSQELRVSKKNVKINLSNLKEDKVIELRPQQTTAKSFRSAIQLQSRITDLRKAFLRSLKEKEKLNETSNQHVTPRRGKIPKQFTYDYDFNVMESSQQIKNGTIRSPLKTKSISTAEITKKIKNPEINHDNQSNLEEQLARKSTALPQKEKRVYNNASRRQVSHFPYIALAQNSILYQNDNILHGPGSEIQAQTCHSWRRKSSFTPFFDKTMKQQSSTNLITQNEDVVFPATIRKELSKSLNINGSIMKNPRYFKKPGNNQVEQSRTYVQFNPLNVTRNLAIDKYYKIKAINN